MYKIKPAYKDYLWGGEKLKKYYGKKCDLKILAESWELSTHKDGQSLIQIGDKEENLAEYIRREGRHVLGDKCSMEDQLPILIKLIDAKDNLSVQVHPDDEYALQNEGDLGKTEMWYVLEADEGAQLVYGFKEEVTEEQFQHYIETNTLTDVLNYVDVKKGDTFFITPGTMHAIGKGIVIAEIQESSNITYRVYDYGRLGTDGKPRALHVEKAKEVTKLSKAGKSKVEYTLNTYEGYKKAVLAECEYFTAILFDIENQVNLKADAHSFESLLIVDGEFEVEEEQEMHKAQKGDSFFVPAGDESYLLKGAGKVILTTL